MVIIFIDVTQCCKVALFTKLKPNLLHEMNLQEAVKQVLPSVIELRRSIHREPEPGYQEYKTAAKVLDYIKDLDGLHIRQAVAETGLVITLGKDKPGKCLGLRADMDCLPIEETTGAEYSSQIPGYMHACGHDAHTSMLAGALRVLHGQQEQLKGPVKFIFQPAEEGGAGAKRMIEEGALENPVVSNMYALHGMPTLQLGKLGLRPGAIWASSDYLEIEITGKGSHAAYPHQGVDPWVVAAQITIALQTRVSRYRDPLNPLVISLCQIEGGSTFNVIPDKVKMIGTFRTLDEDLRQQMFVEIKRLCESMAEALGAKAEVRYGENGYPVGINDDAEDVFTREAFAEYLGEEVIETVKPTMGGEDFAFFGQVVPSNFWLVGLNEGPVGSHPKVHQSNFDFNEKALAQGIASHCAVALHYQQRAY